MVEAISHVRFSWNQDWTKCRALAFDASGQALGEVVIDLPEHTYRRIWARHAGSARLRVEELAERHLRAMLDLRY